MGASLLIQHAAQVVTCSGNKAKKGAAMAEVEVIEDGAIFMENGIIIEVGPTAEVTAKYPKADHIVDATGKSVLPGFVDSHTHFIFGGYRPDEFAWRLRGDTYMDIMKRGGGIAATVSATRAASLDELIQSGRDRLDSMLEFGVTTVEGKSGYGLEAETELRQLTAMERLNAEHPMDIVPTFLGAHATPPEYKGREEDFLEYLIALLPEIREKNLACFCDIFCEKDVFSIAQSHKLLTAAREAGFGLKIHADEIVQLGGAELAAELNAVSADHLLQASDAGIRDLAASNTVATLLPATAFSLREPYARGREMIDHGCAVALATDFNPGSCFSNSIPLIFALACLYMQLSPEEAVSALTINGAAALGLADKIGSIDPGKQADLVILKYPSYRFIPYHVGVNIVETVIKNGAVVLPKHDAKISL